MKKKRAKQTQRSGALCLLFGAACCLALRSLRSLRPAHTWLLPPQPGDRLGACSAGTILRERGLK